MAMEKTFDAGREEPEIYEGWERAGAFRAGAGAPPGADSFCIMIPPPNVTGSLHMGHAFNNTLQDILIRWKRMQGVDVLWQPGTDHAGIATQMVTEREMAANGEPTRREMGREAFVRRVWRQKVASRGTIIGQLQRLGASCDWSREAFTMSGAPGAPAGEEGNFHDAVIRAFVDLYNRGAIHRGKRLVNWDPHFETAISDLEVEQVEVDGHLWRLRYPLEGGETYEYVETDEEGQETLRETRDYLVVATTRPETMLGDTGVAVHPDDARYAHLIGKMVRLPIVGRSIPIVADPHADPEKGTGAVKITPAHDFNDWEVGQRCGLRAVNVMTERAEIRMQGNRDFLEGIDPPDWGVLHSLNGLKREKARVRIVALAEEQGWLDGIDADRHMVPHGDRSKVAVEPYLTDQWFVDAEKLVGPAIEGVRRGLARRAGEVDARGKPPGTAILPEQDAKVYFHWLENIEPWCISRQLWWGHRIPVWYGRERSDEPGVVGWTDRKLEFCAANEAQAIELAKQHYGVSKIVVLESPPTGDLDPRFEAHQPNLSPGHADLEYIYRDPDVLDTWFSSGIWPLATLGWPEETPELKRYFPSDVLITGFDIIFFWVARMMMMQHALVGERPFHTVYVHALVRDAEGKKMSKSLGNVLDPIELIDEFGADAVRFTLASLAAMGRDVKLSKDRIAGYRNFTTKLWNAARFAEMNGAVPDPDFDPSAVTETVNRWIVAETARARASTDAALEGFRFNDAANGLYSFVWGRVCDWYLEFAKPLFDGPAAAETRATLAWVIDQCLILLHPFMPYVTEALWGRIAARDRMLILADWPLHGAGLHAPEAEDEIGWVIALIEELRSARAELGVPAGARLDLRVVELTAGRRAALARHWPLIARLARLSEATDAPEMPRGAVTVALEGGTLALPLAGHVDIAAETARLEKARAKLAKDIAGLEGRLANERFLANAPEAVVEDTRAQARARADEAARLDAALARLAEAGA